MINRFQAKYVKCFKWPLAICASNVEMLFNNYDIVQS